jgi:hypothetical protein
MLGQYGRKSPALENRTLVASNTKDIKATAPRPPTGPMRCRHNRFNPYRTNVTSSIPGGDWSTINKTYYPRRLILSRFVIALAMYQISPGDPAVVGAERSGADDFEDTNDGLCG